MLNGLYVNEFFQVNHTWYGVMKHKNNPSFCRYVAITYFRPNDFDWMSLTPTLEKAIGHIYHEEKAKRKK